MDNAGSIAFDPLCTCGHGRLGLHGTYGTSRCGADDCVCSSYMARRPDPDLYPPSLRRLFAAQYLPIEISDYDREHVGDILESTAPNGTISFSHMLVALVCKADASQREVLRRVYPTHVEAFEAWQVQR